MNFTRPRFHQFALEAEAMSQSESTAQAETWWIRVDEVCAKLGMSAYEGNLLADLMEHEGWARISRTDPIQLRLTLKGFDEIAKLRQPSWKRWTAKYWHPILTTVAVAAAVITLIARFLGF